MIRKRYTLVIVLAFICIFTGILRVNVEYNKLNGKAYDEETYKNIYPDDRKISDAFGEFVIDRNKGARVRMYFTASPFDLRFSVGNKVVYINSSIFKAGKDNDRVAEN